MITGVYKIADTVFEIVSIFSEVQELCVEYKCKETPGFTITIEQKDIDFEREKSRLEDIKEGIAVREFSDSYLETLAVYRKLCEILIDKGTILFHGSVIAVDGIGYLFTAKSGTGKSTHTRLWREYFGDRAVMINDDKPLIKITDTEVTVYGTPWDGKHRISTNTSVPLKAICILERGSENEIRKITKSQAYPMLLQQTHRPADMKKMQNVFTLLDKMCKNIVLYNLKCNMNTDAVTTAYNGMNTEE